MKRKLLYLSAFLLFFATTKLAFAQNYNVPPIANFAYDFGIDTVWVNSPYTFVNTSTNDSANYWVIVNIPDVKPCVTGWGCFDGIQSSPTRNFVYTFIDTGLFVVKLVVRNKSGRDSLTKQVYVGLPTQKPIANFFIDKQVMGLSEQVPLFDLSQNGPTSWSWSLNPPCRNNCGDPNGVNDFINNSFVKQPKLRARDAGVYDICLKVTNNVGSDSVCRKNYVQIIGGTWSCAGPQDTVSFEGSGYVYDNGGPNQQYFTSVMDPNCKFRIDPCASQVTIFVEQFKLRTVDRITFRDGGATGPVIKTLIGGANLTAADKIITANSGVMWFQWTVGAGNSTPVDSGFVFRWTSVPANYPPPTAKFTCPDTVYVGYEVNYINQSTGNGNLTYAWDRDGAGATADWTQPNGAKWTFSGTSQYSANVCLAVTNCKGTSTFCKRITILPIVTTPVVSFYSPRPAGFTTDLFSLINTSKNGANSFLWTITPNNVIYKNGTSSTSENPLFNLTARGIYTVTLRASNALGQETVTKEFYLSVLAYSSPNTEINISQAHDIGISRVRFANVDTTTGLKTPVYDTLYNRWIGKLFRGVEYDLDVFRQTTNIAMDRKAWIDFNIDGDFVDAGELIMSEINAKTISKNVKFKINNDIAPGRVTRLRVGISEGNSVLTPDKATSGCFEDYSIEVGLDDTIPSITLNGESTLRIEVNKTFVDPWVTAMDNKEGDISFRVERITNVDTAVTGYYWAKYFVKDLYGNVSDTAFRLIQVEINRTGPSITLNAPDSVFIPVLTGTYTLPSPTAVDNLGNPIGSNKITRQGSVNTNVIGNYQVIFYVVDQFGFIDSAVQNVYVRDIEAPFLRTFNQASQVVKHQVATPYNHQQIVWGDAYYNNDQLLFTYTGSVNSSLPGSYNLTYNLCDPSGNCAPTLYVQVDVQDTVPPNVILLGQNPMEIGVFEGMPSIGAEVFFFDNYYDSAGIISFYTDNIDFNKLGSYSRVYTVRDGAGNETKITRIVNVVDKEAPRIELLGGNTLDLFYNDTFVEPGYKLVDNYYNQTSLEPLLVKTTTLEKSNNKWYGGARGWKEVKYTLTDSSGNVAREARRVIYVDFKSGLLNAAKNNTQLSVYPNPSNGQFSLSLKEALVGEVTINLYNILGEVVYTNITKNGIQSGHQINALGLSKGVYMLQLQNQGKVFTQKLTVN